MNIQINDDPKIAKIDGVDFECDLNIDGYYYKYYEVIKGNRLKYLGDNEKQLSNYSKIFYCDRKQKPLYGLFLVYDGIVDGIRPYIQLTDMIEQKIELNVDETANKMWVLNSNYIGDPKKSNTINKFLDSLPKEYKKHIKRSLEIKNTTYAGKLNGHWKLCISTNFAEGYDFIGGIPFRDSMTFKKTISRTSLGKKHDVAQNSFTILSYNVCYQAMLGRDIHTAYGEKCKSNGENQCVKNIIKYITGYGRTCDFIALQEFPPELFDKIDKNEEITKTHNVVKTTMRNEGQLTLYSNTFKQECVVRGYLGTIGRAMTMIFFGHPHNICFINVHFGHDFDKKMNDGISDMFLGTHDKIDAFQLSWHIEGLLNGSKEKSRRYHRGEYVQEYIKHPNSHAFFVDCPTTISQQDIKKKLRTYDIILAGDFNDSLRLIRNEYILNIDDGRGGMRQRKLSGMTTKPTCCNSSLANDANFSLINDHILYSDKFISNNLDIQMKSKGLMSDHLPIKRTITYK